MNHLLHLFIAIILVPSGVFAGLRPQQGTIEIVRTVRVDKVVMGVTSDFEMIAFNCEHGLFSSSQPVAVIENTKNTITFKDSTAGGLRMYVPPDLSKTLQLSQQAAKIICSDENEQPVVLKVNQSQLELADAKTH